MSYKDTQTVIKLITDMFVVVVTRAIVLYQHTCRFSMCAPTPGMQVQHMPGCFCVLFQHTTFYNVRIRNMVKHTDTCIQK